MRAYGLARVRVMRSRLVGRDRLPVLRGVQGARPYAQALEALGLDAADPRGALAVLTGRLGDRLAHLSRIYPDAAATFEALAGLQEIENLKLGWRALTRRLPTERWLPAWRPLGRAARLAPEAFREAGSLHELPPRIARTPYGEIADTELRTHATDPEAAELAFDRFAGRRVVAALRALPAHEALARSLLEDLVRARDLEIVGRTARRGDLGAEAAVGLAAILGDEVRPAALRAFAEWTSADGPLAARLPRVVLRHPEGIADPPALRRRLAARRRLACTRAMRDGGFSLAPPIAYALLAAGEVDALLALVEAGMREDVGDALEPALLASALGG